MTPSEVYNNSHNSNCFHIHFYDETVLKRLGEMYNEYCMHESGRKLNIPEGNYNYPQHLVDQTQSAIEDFTSNPHYDHIKLNQVIV